MHSAPCTCEEAAAQPNYTHLQRHTVPQAQASEAKHPGNTASYVQAYTVSPQRHCSVGTQPAPASAVLGAHASVW